MFVRKKIAIAGVSIAALIAGGMVWYFFFAPSYIKTKYRFDSRENISFADIFEGNEEVLIVNLFLNDKQTDIYDLLNSVTYECLPKLQGKMLKGEEAPEFEDPNNYVWFVWSDKKSHTIVAYIYLDQRTNKYVLLCHHTMIEMIYDDKYKTEMSELIGEYYTYYVPEDQEKLKPLEEYFALQRQRREDKEYPIIQ